jgi:membrane protein
MKPDMKHIQQVPKHIAKWHDTLWLQEREKKAPWYVLFIRILEILWRGIFENSLFSRASALSFSSLLALAPILGIFVILSGSFLRVNTEDHVKQALFLIAPSLEEYVNGDGVSPAQPTAPQQTASVPATPSTTAASPLPPKAQSPEPAANAAQTPAPVSSSATSSTQRAAPQQTLPAQAAPTPALSPDQKQAHEMNHALDLLISHMIQGVRDNISGISKSGKSVASVIGGLVLIWMGIILLVAVENTMNNIWGVKSGRAWSKKLVLYWALLSLGILGALALVGLSSAATLGKILDSLPFGANLSRHTTSVGAVLTGISLTLILTLFYKFFPNTRVRFGPAFIGGFVAALLLVANKLFATMYINRVITIQSLFGSMGIILVLMFGLYLFWAFLLIGAQLTYAVQNAKFLADQRAWAHASSRARETIAIAALVLVSRRFSRCEPALSSDEIAETLRVPSNVLNEALVKLCEMGCLTALESNSPERRGSDRLCFTPARPVSSITFAIFHDAYMGLGEDRGVEQLREADPVVDLFWQRMTEAVNTLSGDSIEALLSRAEQEENDASTPESGESR